MLVVVLLTNRLFYFVPDIDARSLTAVVVFPPSVKLKKTCRSRCQIYRQIGQYDEWSGDLATCSSPMPLHPGVTCEYLFSVGDSYQRTSSFHHSYACKLRVNICHIYACKYAIFTGISAVMHKKLLSLTWGLGCVLRLKSPSLLSNYYRVEL